jgi:hydrogenase maturation protein HypF
VPNSSTKHNQRGVEIHVQGTVQGVGFRPFIYNLACRLGISGSVINTGDGVVIMAAGPSDRLDCFLTAITEEAPPLAHIAEMEAHLVSLPFDQGTTGFIILPSSDDGGNTAIPPDIALCDECRQELLDPGNRRCGYPFTNCTNCGPRFTIVHHIPYDRPQTSMASFTLCADCAQEYHDPANRRFHAQPNACHICGPSLTLYKNGSKRWDTSDPISASATLLSQGHIIAMRGMGGFHLVADACSDEAVSLLRRRKGRPDKPLAIMVKDVEMAKTFCQLGETEEALLRSPVHPIVLLEKFSGTTLSALLAPAIGEIGVMLPYTPLHHLLLHSDTCPAALVMTSGNSSGSPICTDNADARERLAHIADDFLLHNREIVTRVDDSVTKVVAGRTQVLRRARGFVPSPLYIDMELPRILGCGAGLKNTFCLARGNTVFASQHIGDLDNLDTYEFFGESVAHLQSLLAFRPEAVACDLHPDYLSSRYAASLDLPLYQVQHHHAHAVAVMAEHRLGGPVLAAVLDGTGLGDDGTLWGGEILVTSLTSYRRLAHLSHLSLPGGDAAAIEPWRMAISALHQTYGSPALFSHMPQALSSLDRDSVTTVVSMLDQDFNCPPTSSCGRLFDAIAALLGVRLKLSYEGQAAMELEALAKTGRPADWQRDILPNSPSQLAPFLTRRDGKWEISCREFVTMTLDALAQGEPAPLIAWRFHRQLIGTLVQLLHLLSEENGIRQIVLSGGCMQNSILLEGLLYALPTTELQVYTGNQLPVNDGGVSIGQTIIGGLRHVSRHPHAGHKRSG